LGLVRKVESRPIHRHQSILNNPMVHHRLRTVNTRGSFLAPDLDFGISEAVLADDQVFLGGCTGLTLDGNGFVGEGDPAAQAETAMRNVRTLLEEAGARMEDVCLVNNFTTNREDRALVYPVIARHLEGVNVVSTGLIVKELAEPYITFEIDVWAVVPRDREKGHGRFRLTNARGGYLMPALNYANARSIRANDHIFLQGQTGMTLDGRNFDGEGDPGRQADVAMQNVRELLADAGSGIEDVCKITTYLTDPAHRSQIHPVLARHFKDVHPAWTSTVVKGLARSELNFEIDVFAFIPQDRERGHERFGVTDPVDPGDGIPRSRAVRAGNFVYIQGANGHDPGGDRSTLPGDPPEQAERTMDNVRRLLEEAGARMEDICKITTMVADHAHRAEVYPVLGRHLDGVYPVCTGLVMQGLSRPELNFEMDVFAVLPPGGEMGSQDRFILPTPATGKP
jgi:enamine deaminase RidA (YjgF/YER057c/UK114 family)